MPPGCKVKNAQRPDPNVSCSEKADDLSMDDWNFLLRFQDPEQPATWAHAATGAQANAGSIGEQAALLAPPGQSLSPAAWAQLEQREAPLGQRRERVQHWELAYKQLQRVATAEGGALQRQHHRIWERFRAQTAPPPETQSSSRILVPHRASMSASTAHGPLSDQALLRRQVQLSERQAPSADAQSPAPDMQLPGVSSAMLSAPCTSASTGANLLNWASVGMALPNLGRAVRLPQQQHLTIGGCQHGENDSPVLRQRQCGPSGVRASPGRRGSTDRGWRAGRTTSRLQEAARSLFGEPEVCSGKALPAQAHGQGGICSAKDAAVRAGPALRAQQHFEAGEPASGWAGSKEEAGAAMGWQGRLRMPSKRRREVAADKEEEEDDEEDEGCERAAATVNASPPGSAKAQQPPAKAATAAHARDTGKTGSGSMQKRQLGAASSSRFRGVSRHRLTQRWEASLWLAGKQMYLGGFVAEEDAARAYDLAALACKGLTVPTNFAASQYSQSLAEVSGSSREEIVAWVRRRSSAFSRGRSRFRGVSGQAGHWEARIGTFGGRKNVSFGIHESEEEAAHQYDRALIVEKGRAAKTNFPINTYDEEVIAFEAFTARRCGSLRNAEAALLLAHMTLPFDPSSPDGCRVMKSPVREKSKGGRPRNNAATVIYAATLQQALQA